MNGWAYHVAHLHRPGEVTSPSPPSSPGKSSLANKHNSLQVSRFRWIRPILQSQSLQGGFLLCFSNRRWDSSDIDLIQHSKGDISHSEADQTLTWDVISPHSYRLHKWNLSARSRDCVLWSKGVHKLPQHINIKWTLIKSPPLIIHTYSILPQPDGEVAWQKGVETSLNTWVRYIICYLTSIGVFGRYEQQEKQGVTGRHQCINHVILFISEEHGWPSNSHVLCNMNGAKRA